MQQGVYDNIWKNKINWGEQKTAVGVHCTAQNEPIT